MRAQDSLLLDISARAVSGIRWYQKFSQELISNGGPSGTESRIEISGLSGTGLRCGEVIDVTALTAGEIGGVQAVLAIGVAQAIHGAFFSRHFQKFKLL